ncbi:MAG: 50S ribosomal protein L35 [Planctomycetota bacterium]
MAKPGKFKPNKSVLKRVKRTGSGRFKRSRAGTSHLNSHMSGKRIRRLRQSAMCPKCEETRLRRMLQLPLPK